MAIDSESPRRDTPAGEIVVKFMAKGHYEKDKAIFLRQFPGMNPVWGRCRFVFDPDVREYDWVAVYDDLAPIDGERFSKRVEQLACPQQNTLFITMEPSSIKTYGFDFLEQFGVVITSQEPWAIRNRGAVYTQPALRWFYGESKDGLITYDQMQAHPPVEKSAVLSTVCSNKQQKHTLHQLRYDFTQQLRSCLPELDVFGRGVRPIADKAEAVDPYRYHIAIENHICQHHWTEKLSDAFLGVSLPFYSGCPNAAEYFPAESFIPIDIYDVEGSVRTMRDAIENGEFERRLPAILEARRRVLEEYNLFAVIAREIELRSGSSESAAVHTARSRGDTPGGELWSRHSMRYRSLGNIVRFTCERWRTNRLQTKRQRAA